jgi:hypothetical protein
MVSSDTTQRGLLVTIIVVIVALSIWSLLGSFYAFRDRAAKATMLLYRAFGKKAGGSATVLAGDDSPTTITANTAYDTLIDVNCSEQEPLD